MTNPSHTGTVLRFSNTQYIRSYRGGSWFESAATHRRTRDNATGDQMVIAGSIVGILGLVLLLNVLQSADRLAAFSRPFPWWLKGAGANNPIAHRLVGAGFVVMGLAFIAVGLRL